MDFIDDWTDNNTDDSDQYGIKGEPGSVGLAMKGKGAIMTLETLRAARALRFGSRCSEQYLRSMRSKWQLKMRSRVRSDKECRDVFFGANPNEKRAW